MNNVVVRAISGAAYVAIIVGAILAGHIYFYSLLVLLAILGVLELSRIDSQDISWPATILDCLGAITIIFLPISFAMGLVGSVCLLATLLFLFILRIVVAIYDLSGNAFKNIAMSMLGVCYLGIPLSALAIVYGDNDSFKTLVLIMFILIWLNDTGAFLTGSTFGKHRLCERLSPKKSWEGFFGGMLCCIAFGIVCSLFWNPVGWNILVWVLYAIVVCVFSTWGDLFESMIKRSLNVKDSGHLIPGHGGILDRIDSLLLVAPATAIFVFLVILLTLNNI